MFITLALCAAVVVAAIVAVTVLGMWAEDRIDRGPK